LSIKRKARQPFADRAHDQVLALSICNGIRPENDSPKCYIDLVKSAETIDRILREIEDEIDLFRNSKYSNNDNDSGIVNQLKKTNILAIENTHPKLFIFNPYTGLNVKIRDAVGTTMHWDEPYHN